MIFRSIFLFFLLPYLAHAQTKLTYTYTINIVNEYEGIRSDITFDTLSGEIIFDTSSDSFTTSIQLEPTNKSQLKDTKLIGSFLLAAIRSNIAFNNDQKLRSLIRNLALNEDIIIDKYQLNLQTGYIDFMIKPKTQYPLKCSLKGYLVPDESDQNTVKEVKALFKKYTDVNALGYDTYSTVHLKRLD